MASMGPGSFDPGSPAYPIVDNRLRSCFNGAGVFRPRKWRLGASGVAARRKLQWGRGLSTPEVNDRPVGLLERPAASMGPGSFDPGSAVAAAAADDDDAASMGPGSFDPGSPIQRTSTSRMSLLQWGRGLSTPEVGLVHVTGQADPRFNGAGVFRPRKFAEYVRRPGGSVRFNGAGVFRPRKSAQQEQNGSEPPGASMGPGSFDPGS